MKPICRIALIALVTTNLNTYASPNKGFDSLDDQELCFIHGITAAKERGHVYELFLKEIERRLHMAISSKAFLDKCEDQMEQGQRQAAKEGFPSPKRGDHPLSKVIPSRG